MQSVSKTWLAKLWLKALVEHAFRCLKVLKVQKDNLNVFRDANLTGVLRVFILKNQCRISPCACDLSHQAKDTSIPSRNLLMMPTLQADSRLTPPKTVSREQ
jgi:hypothetical protein